VTFNSECAVSTPVYAPAVGEEHSFAVASIFFVLLTRDAIFRLMARHIPLRLAE
jgi:hypothetical protein